MKWHIHTGVHTITYVWSTVILISLWTLHLVILVTWLRLRPLPLYQRLHLVWWYAHKQQDPSPSPRRRVGCEASICLLGAPAPDHHHPSTWTHTQTYIRTYIRTYIHTYLYLHLHQSHHPIYTKNVFLAINLSLVHKYVCRQLWAAYMHRWLVAMAGGWLLWRESDMYGDHSSCLSVWIHAHWTCHSHTSAWCHRRGAAQCSQG